MEKKRTFYSILGFEDFKKIDNENIVTNAAYSKTIEVIKLLGDGKINKEELLSRINEIQEAHDCLINHGNRLNYINSILNNEAAFETLKLDTFKSINDISSIYGSYLSRMILAREECGRENNINNYIIKAANTILDLTDEKLIDKVTYMVEYVALNSGHRILGNDPIWRFELLMDYISKMSDKSEIAIKILDLSTEMYKGFVLIYGKACYNDIIHLLVMYPEYIDEFQEYVEKVINNNAGNSNWKIDIGINKYISKVSNRKSNNNDGNKTLIKGRKEKKAIPDVAADNE